MILRVAFAHHCSLLAALLAWATANEAIARTPSHPIGRLRHPHTCSLEFGPPMNRKEVPTQRRLRHVAV